MVQICVCLNNKFSTYCSCVTVACLSFHSKTDQYFPVSIFHNKPFSGRYKTSRVCTLYCKPWIAKTEPYKCIGGSFTHMIWWYQHKPMLSFSTCFVSVTIKTVWDLNLITCFIWTRLLFRHTLAALCRKGKYTLVLSFILNYPSCLITVCAVGVTPVTCSRPMEPNSAAKLFLALRCFSKSISISPVSAHATDTVVVVSVTILFIEKIKLAGKCIKFLCSSPAIIFINCTKH